MAPSHVHQIRVIFGDTDQMGVVYYANYLRYFEGARASLLRELGKSYRDMVEWGIALPVTEAHCRYRRPARFEDLLDVEVRVGEVRGASLRFVYQIHSGGEKIADGYTVHACVDLDTGMPRRMPEQLRALIGTDPSG